MFTKQVGSVYSQGMAYRVLGQALAAAVPSSRYAEARTQLDTSLQLLESGAALLEAAYTQLVLGQLCLAQGEHETARTAFAKAAAQYEASGLDVPLAQARRLLERAAEPADHLTGEPRR
jgi:hypothetical protein